MNKKATATGILIVCLSAAAMVSAAQDITGEWEFKSQLPGMSFSATMTITKNADGKYSGTWSGQFGEGTLSDITFENNTLKFVQTSDFGGQEVKTTYETTLDGTKIKGKSKNQFGEAAVEGNLSAAGEAKKGADAIAGTWEINITVPARDIKDKLTITKSADGNYAGKWEGARGENTISDIKFEAGKLTFTRTGKMGQMEFTSAFEGTIEGDQIKGTFRNDFGEMPITATHIIAKGETAKAEEKKTEAKPEPNKTK